MRILTGMRIKSIIFTILLFLFSVCAIVIPIAIEIFRSSQQLIAQDLYNRTVLFLDSIVGNAESYLRGMDGDKDHPLFFPGIPYNDLQSVVILGKNPGHGDGVIDTVLFSSKDNIDVLQGPVDSLSGSIYFQTQYIDIIVHKITNLEEKVATLVRQYHTTIKPLVHTLNKISERPFSTGSSQQKHTLELRIEQEKKHLQKKLFFLAKKAGSTIPDYTVQEIAKNSSYVFYRPIVYYDPKTASAGVQGVLCVTVSMSYAQKTIATWYHKIIKIAGAVVLLLLFLVFLTILWMRAFFVQPIKGISTQIMDMLSSDEQSQTISRSIAIHSNDELGRLSYSLENINDQFVQNAILKKDLAFGKEIQKMFIPLQSTDGGGKLSTGFYRDANADFFGYYEGAHGVSGDYFDYIKLDDRHYAVIKCDIAGKGVPAALLMVEVATLFQSYFKIWDYKRHGYNLRDIVVHINDVIVSHGFSGRFAAFSLCIINMKSGNAYFCNAGCSVVHIFRRNKKKMVAYPLRSAPPAGAFASDTVTENGGFFVEKAYLEYGDVLFLYTDGIEESKRAVSQSLFGTDKILQNLKKTHKKKPALHNLEYEIFGDTRIHEIVEAVFSRTSFSLYMQQNDGSAEQLQFDFSVCGGTMYDAVLALISVEKVFRMYKVPHAADEVCAQIDKKIDTFLRSCFLQYQDYCKKKGLHPLDNDYLYYEGVKENTQYDDLTILAVQRNMPEC